MGNYVTLLCPRCCNTQERAYRSRQICCACRIDEEKFIGKTQKGKAWAASQKALRSGDLVRQPCEVCGADKSEAHHDDYAKALDVRWLCRSCHRRHHLAHGPGKNAIAPTFTQPGE